MPLALNLDDLFKSGEPQGKPRSGHKYIRREWGGERWNYFYANDPAAAHGFGAVRDLQDPVFSHSLEVTVDDLHENPEESYKNALSKAMKDPSQAHKVASPHGGEPWSVKVNIAGKKATLSVHDSEGNVLKDGIASRGAYEMWYLGVAHQQTFNDHNGDSFMHLMPNVGQVKNGELHPSTDENRKWIVRLTDAFCERTGAKAQKWQYPSRELAEKHIQKSLRNRHIAEGGGDVRTSLEHLPDEERDAVQSALSEGGSMHAAPGSVADQIQSGKLKYKMKDVKNRQLDVSDSEKQKLISQAAKEYWPVALARANEMYESNSHFGKDRGRNKREWLEQFLGNPLPDESYEKEPDGRPKIVAPDPSSAYYEALSSAMDNYDPSHGVGFTGYLASSKGRIWSRMKGHQDKFIQEMKGTGANGTVDAGDGSGQVSRGDIKAATKDQMATQAFYQSPDQQVDAHDDWHNSTNQLLNTWEQQAPNENPAIRDKMREVMGQIRRLPTDQRQEAAKRLSQMLIDMGVHKYVQKALRMMDALEVMKNFRSSAQVN